MIWGQVHLFLEYHSSKATAKHSQSWLTSENKMFKHSQYHMIQQLFNSLSLHCFAMHKQNSSPVLELIGKSLAAYAEEGVRSPFLSENTITHLTHRTCLYIFFNTLFFVKVLYISFFTWKYVGARISYGHVLIFKLIPLQLFQNQKWRHFSQCACLRKCVFELTMTPTFLCFPNVFGKKSFLRYSMRLHLTA